MSQFIRWIGSSLQAATVVVAGALVLAAPSQAATAVDFWSPFTGPDGAAVDQLVKQFNETKGKADGVEIKLLIIPWEQYYTKLSVALASRKGPALAIVHAHRIAGLARQGALEALSDAEITAAALDQSDYLPALFQAGIFSGKRYGIPIDAFPRHLYINNAVFKAAGLDPAMSLRTGDELLAAARKIKAAGGEGFPLFLRLSGASTARDFYSLYWQFNKDLLSADGKDVAPGFEDAAVKAMTITKSFLDEKLASPVDVPQYDRLFAQNKIGIVFSQITDLAQFQATPELSYSVAPMPQFGPRRATFALGHNFVIPRGAGAAERKASLVFARWINDNGIEWARTGKTPAKLSVLNSESFRKLPEQSAISLPEMIQFPPSIVAQPEVDRIIQENLEALYGGRLSPKDAATAMMAAIRKELAK